MIQGIAARWRAAPWGLIGAVILIVGVERKVSRHRADVTTETAACWAFAAASAGGEAARSEILGFGDSLIKYAFQPQVIEARTGRKAFNLAGYAAPPSRDYLMLKRVLAAGGKPSALVVYFGVIHLGGAPRFHERRFAEFVTAAEAFELARTSRDPGLFGLLMTGRHIPSVRARFEIRGNVMTALSGQGLKWADAFYPLRRNWNQARGAHVGSNEPHAPDDPEAARARALELYAYEYQDVAWGQSVEERYIRRFLDLAVERNIPVYWVLPPLPPTLEQRQREVRVTELTDALARRISHDYANVVVVDGRGRGYDPTAFCADDVHLNCRGANAFSRDLADLIRHRSGNSEPAPAWVTLPRYRPGEMVANLEDLAHTIAFLRKAWEVQR